MKHTEQRWMHIETGMLVERAGKPAGSCMKDYRLVTVTWDEPEYEDVEVVRWVNVYPETIRCFATEGEANEAAADNRIACVKLTGTYRRRKPEPEVWEGTTKRSVQGDVAMIQLSPSWIGKKVRVEVVE